MKKNKVFKIIAIVALALAIIGIFVPKNISFYIELIAATTLFVVGILNWIIPSKEHTIVKLIILIALYLSMLSWVINASASSGATEVASLGLMRISLYQIMYYPLLATQFFLQPLLFMLSVGGLYGVLAQTGKYRNQLEKIAKSMKGKEELFLILTSLILAIISSVFGLSLLLFTIIPLLCGIIILMGYDKITAFMTTFISPLIGIIGCTYGVYIIGYINNAIGSEFSTEIIAKVALFVISYLVYISFLIKHSKKAKTKNEKIENEEELSFLGEKKQSKKASWPIFIILGLVLLLTILGCTGWKDVFEITFFEDLHEQITSWSINGNTIISYLTTDLEAFGQWYFTEITVLILASSLIIAKVYNLKFKDSLSAFGSGVIKTLKPAFIVIFAYVIVIITAYHPIFVTITDGMMGLANSVSGVFGDILYIFAAGINTILSSLLNIDMMYLVQSSLPYITNHYTNAANSLAIITQSLYGLTLFIAPTSTMMILGLEYLGIPYKEWLKASWKLVLSLLAVILIIICIVVFI